MTDRELLVHRFKALMGSIGKSKLYQTAPNLTADEHRRLAARVDQDIAEGMKLSQKIAELDMRKPAGAAAKPSFGASLLNSRLWSEPSIAE
jgi:hypothetical protein